VFFESKFYIKAGVFWALKLGGLRGGFTSHPSIHFFYARFRLRLRRASKKHSGRTVEKITLLHGITVLFTNKNTKKMETRIKAHGDTKPSGTGQFLTARLPPPLVLSASRSPKWAE
jgi:hypothetical protein